MTYLKPKKWWMWFGRFIAKCQSIDYKQQYESGARWFDFRLSFPKDKNGNYCQPVFSHGLMDYKGATPTEVFEYFNDKPDVYCRIVLEKGGDTEIDLFKFYVARWMMTYPNLKITQIAKKNQWGMKLIEPNATTPYSLKDAYASTNGYYPEYQKLPGILRSKTWSGLLIDDLWPWIYAKFNNKKNIKKHKEQNVVLLLDFIKPEYKNF
ncbi:MAG: hypothetical protein NC548_40580 [Lachnospiraceae bacterium]|nr:hypothetical protein [Lachnospiraceae bacterium]